MTAQISGALTVEFAVKVLIVDDHPIVISGCRALLSGDSGIEMLDAGDAREALRLFMEHRPDVCVVDINLPDLSGFELTRQIRALKPDAKILIFSMNDDPIFVAQSIESGASGYISKNGDLAGIREAIRMVADGQLWLPSKLAEKVAFLNQNRANAAQVKFSTRDLEILRMLANGKNMSEAAALLGISYKTMANTCSLLRAKLEARTAVEMIRNALERKII